MFTIFIIILSLWVLAFLYSIITDSDAGFFSFILVSGIWIGLVISAIYDSCHPTAMDVYQNKTTLEITYKNNIPIDSTVVFKE
jgi:hypothetical protein